MRNKTNQKQLKQLWNKFLWLTVLLGIVAMLWFSIDTHLKSRINRLKVSIDGTEGSRNLISREMAEKQIEQFFGVNIMEVKFKQLKPRVLEDALIRDSRIEDADVYLDGSNALHVHIKQRSPVVRVMADNGEDYYLDKYGVQIMTVKNSAVRVPIASGNIDSYAPNWQKMKVHNLHDVLSIAKELPKDDFLQALIEQIYVENDGVITLIPKVGKQELVIGSSQELKKKFRNIKLSYKTVVRLKRFNKYEKINFEITNQIRGIKEESSSSVISS